MDDDTNSKPTNAASLPILDNDVGKPSSTGDKRSPPKASSNQKANPNKKHRTVVEPTFLTKPSLIQIVQMPKTHVNHTYRDFSTVPKDKSARPVSVQATQFGTSLYAWLESPDPCIGWCSHGRAFRIHDVAALRKHSVLQSQFEVSGFAKFRKLLFNHGFKELTLGRDEGCFYHELFLRGLPHLLTYLPEPIKYRKLHSDPHHEPNFYHISQAFPLPHHEEDILREARAGLAARGIFISDSEVMNDRPFRGVDNQTLMSIIGFKLGLNFPGAFQMGRHN